MSIAEKLTTIAENQQKVYDAGYTAGQAAGGGGDSYYDEFWDSVQQNGSRTGYVYGFAGESWTDDTFKPKYNIEVSQVNYMFYYSKITDLQAALERAGVVLDLSNLSVSFMIRPFDSSQITRVGEVNLAHVTGAINTFFANATKLVTIDNLILSSSNTFGSNMFQNCEALANITIQGEIAKTINFQWCTSLTVDSMKSIILALKDFDGNGGTVEGAWTQTITFPDECWTALEADGTRAPNGENWKSYVENKLAWNV